MTGAPLWAALVLAMSSWVAPLAAHEIRPAVADVTIDEARVEVEFRLSLEPLIAGMDLVGLQDTRDSPLAGEYDRLRALSGPELEAELRDRWAALAPEFRILTGEAAWIAEIVSVEIRTDADPGLPRDAILRIGADLPPDGSAVRIGWDRRLGTLALRQFRGTESYAALLQDGALSDPLPRFGLAEVAAPQTFLNYLAYGFVHILPKGLDHILFVLGLFFFATALRPLLWQVTTFTLAHTVTLGLATLGYVSVSPAIVEPLIAASIVWVAVENVLRKGAGRIGPLRLAVVFGFGLLHGLGFATVLMEIEPDPSRLVLWLVGFNIGVELGQLTVVAAALVLVTGLARLFAGGAPAWRARLGVAASVAIAATGAVWMVQRLV